MKKTILTLACALMLAPAISAAAIADDPQTPSEQTEQTDGKEKKEKKEKKKEKKKKEKKKQRTVEEVLSDLQSLEWNKPAKSGLEIDQWYDEADAFFKLVRGIEENVPLYSLRAITNESGTKTIVAPVDKNGVIRHRKESFEQVALGVLYGTNVALQATNLALGTVNNSVQIGLDAVPLVGDANRKKANMQIAKATKAIPLLKEIVTTQNNMMKKYMEMNYDVTGSDADVEAMKELNVDFDNMITQSDDDLEAYLAAESEADSAE